MMTDKSHDSPDARNSAGEHQSGQTGEVTSSGDDFSNTFSKLRGKLTNSQGLSYQEFIKGLKPSYFRAWRDLVFGFMSLAALAVVAVYIQPIDIATSLVYGVLIAAAIGWNMHYIQLFFHEAAHYGLASDRKLNDTLANLTIGVLNGQDIKAYRVVHFDHHRFLGTTKDTENSYFNPLSLRYLLQSFIGVRVIRIVPRRRRHVLEATSTADEKSSGISFRFLRTLMLHAAVIVIAFYSGFWVLGIAWALGVFSFFPLIASIRQLLEHRDENASASDNFFETDHGAISRMFGVGPIASTIGSAGFNRHLLHHWEPQLSYTLLADIEAFLEDTELKSVIDGRRTTYLATFSALVNPLEK